MKHTILGAVVGATLLVGFASAQPTTYDPKTIGRREADGKPIPSFTMKTTDGKRLTRESLRGKVVVIDFWATWCQPCKLAAPTVQRIHDKYKSKGVVVIAANVFEELAGGSSSSPDAAKKYKAQNKYTSTFTYDNSALARSWGVDGLSFFLVIGKDGTILKSLSGFRGDAHLYNALSEAIDRGLAAKTSTRTSGRR